MRCPGTALIILALAVSTWSAAASASSLAVARRRGLRVVRDAATLGLAEKTATLSAREDRIEAVESSEREALQAQQEALEQLASEQEALSARQNSLLAAQQNATAALNRSLLQTLHDGLDFSWQKAGDSYVKNLGRNVAYFFVYLLLACLVGALYLNCCNVAYGPKIPGPGPGTARMVFYDGFQFGLFEFRNSMNDWRICLCACLCPGVRWADTERSPQMQIFKFWPGLILWAILAGLSPLTLGVSVLVLLCIALYCRQKMRQHYGLPRHNCWTFVEDCFSWCCCMCCAIVQEARQVEYVELPRAGMAYPMNRGAPYQPHPMEPHGHGGGDPRYGPPPGGGGVDPRYADDPRYRTHGSPPPPPRRGPPPPGADPYRSHGSPHGSPYGSPPRGRSPMR